ADSCFNIPGPPAPESRLRRNANLVTLPMELINNNINVSGWLNCQGPFRFVVDTGWGTTSITPEVANRLRLVVQETQKSMDAGESTAENRFTKVASIRFGDAQLRNQSLLVTSAFDGRARDAVGDFAG